MKQIGIYIKDETTLEYNRVELFDDEKISITSSIQNINDIAKTYTDFSQTFTVPATKQNNKIFKHWYDNSNDNSFSTLVKSDAYIEIDTIPFRKGKIQLESANIVDGKPQDYSITFIGILGNLKDTFAGLYLKDLTDTTYDFNYTATVVKDKVVTTATSGNVMFPLISSNNFWVYGSGTYRIDQNNHPIYYDDLFPAIRLSAVLSMIETQFGINFDGTFLSDGRFTNAYLYLKNAETFTPSFQKQNIDFISATGSLLGFSYNLTTNTVKLETYTSIYPKQRRLILYGITPTVSGIYYTVFFYKNGILIDSKYNLSSAGVQQSWTFYDSFTATGSYTDFSGSNDVYSYAVSSDSAMTYNFIVVLRTILYNSALTIQATNDTTITNTSQTTTGKLLINQYFTDIKIEDFFSGLLKMFNLTCFSNDGINYTVEQLENYYGLGSDIDITKYVIQDKKTLNRVKAYKKINFEYEKSESLVNVAFNSANGIEYGSLYYSNTPQAEGEEYSIKLPFEDLNFINLKDKLQVGYCLKPDTITKYIPKPIILYDYNPTALTALTGTTFHFATTTSSGGGTGTAYTSYKAFGQEYYNGTNTYGLNFPTQQSTLTNDIVYNGLYSQYYSNYFANIFNIKARLIKISAILPTSILTSLKLNDNVLIRDTKYLINTMTTDLTTGEVQFELLTDQRQ